MNPAIIRVTKPAGAVSGLRRAFTLIEIMVVVAVIGIILSAGVPTLFKMLHKEGFRKTVSDFAEVCKAARSRAILQGVRTRVVFHPKDGRCEVDGGTPPNDAGGLMTSAVVGPGERIDGLFINLIECTTEDAVAVRFFPEGTCDEMVMIMRSDKNEQRGLMLEITTGLVSILDEDDLQKLRNGRL